MSYFDEDYSWLKKKVRQRSEVYGLEEDDVVELFEDAISGIEEGEWSFLQGDNR